jgi:hypothetical protein
VRRTLRVPPCPVVVARSPLLHFTLLIGETSVRRGSSAMRSAAMYRISTEFSRLGFGRSQDALRHHLDTEAADHRVELGQVADRGRCIEQRVGALALGSQPALRLAPAPDLLQHLRPPVLRGLSRLRAISIAAAGGWLGASPINGYRTSAARRWTLVAASASGTSPACTWSSSSGSALRARSVCPHPVLGYVPQDGQALAVVGARRETCGESATSFFASVSSRVRPSERRQPSGPRSGAGDAG